MINGYVTFNELVLITGLPEYKLRKLISAGMKYHTLGYVLENNRTSYKDCLYNLDEVINWIKVHIF